VIRYTAKPGAGASGRVTVPPRWACRTGNPARPATGAAGNASHVLEVSRTEA